MYILVNCMTVYSDVFKDFVFKATAFKAKAKDLQKKQGQGLGTKAKANKYSRPTLRTAKCQKSVTVVNENAIMTITLQRNQYHNTTSVLEIFLSGRYINLHFTISDIQNGKINIFSVLSQLLCPNCQ